MTDGWITSPQPQPLVGDESFKGLDQRVADFWRFAMSDLRTNNTRGYLAEFIVARALGATGQRVEWDSYDVLAASGARVEVKASAYLQVWTQRRPSRIVFTRLAGKAWDDEGHRAQEATYNADVYVFCVHTAKRHDDYDPLDVAQWEFYVLSRATVEHLGLTSIGLPTLKRHSLALTYADLADHVEAAYRE